MLSQTSTICLAFQTRCSSPRLQVAECTCADVPPPSDWAAGFHALVLGPGSCGILRLLVEVLERVPEAMTAQVG